MSRALILMYHSVDTPLNEAESRYCVTPAVFREHMAHLAASGSVAMPLATMVQALKQGGQLPDNAVAVTFDDGFECFQRNALPVLTEFHIPATVFAVSGMLGGTNTWMQAKGWPERKLMNAHELREIQAAGVTVGCHALNHKPMTQLSDEALADETVNARRILSEALETDVTLFAYPHGAQSGRERQAVEKAGFIAACGTEPGFNRHQTDLFALRRIDVYGSDTLASFRRKLQFGANRATLADLANYYFRRIATHFHG
ncbi:MAG: polysaccharide deacetylase family protein [Thiobacillus sp.]|nr:polysaccharide deacetylase family protein [Thiobacillus sp.]